MDDVVKTDEICSTLLPLVSSHDPSLSTTLNDGKIFSTTYFSSAVSALDMWCVLILNVYKLFSSAVLFLCCISSSLHNDQHCFNIFKNPVTWLILTWPHSHLWRDVLMQIRSNLHKIKIGSMPALTGNFLWPTFWVCHDSSLQHPLIVLQLTRFKLG